MGQGRSKKSKLILVTPWCRFKISPHPHLTTFVGRGKPAWGEAGRGGLSRVRRGGAKLSPLGSNSSYQREKKKCINSPSPRHHPLPLSHNLLALMQTNCKEARQMLTIHTHTHIYIYIYIYMLEKIKAPN